MQKRLTALVNKIKSQLENAREAMWGVAREEGYPIPRGVPNGFEDSEGALSHFVEGTYRDLRLLADAMKQSDCLDQIKDREVKWSGKFSTVRYDQEFESISAPALDAATQLFESLLVAGAGDDAGRSFPFENILRSTAKIVLETGVDPKSETDIKDAVFKIIKYAYPDAVRNHVFTHAVKNYVPDFLASSAQALAEFKYAVDKKELDAACDQLSADMAGYTGDDRITAKYGLIYLASPFSNQVEVDAHFVSVTKPEEWTMIVVNGAGSRKAKL